MIRRLIWSVCGRVRDLRLLIERSICISSNVRRTIVCNNCLAGMIYHDYDLQFCSPFINLMIPTRHYIEMLKEIHNIKYWTFMDISSSKYNYPIGLLNAKWEVHFMHYTSYEEAIAKWKERVARMDVSNIYVILVETHLCSSDDLLEFDKLPYRKKVALTSQEYPKIRCSYKLPNYDGQNTNGELFWPSNKWGTRKYDFYNWPNFLELK